MISPDSPTVMELPSKGNVNVLEGVICDVATKDVLQEHRDYETRALPPRSLRGFGVLEPMAVRRTWADQPAPEQP